MSAHTNPENGDVLVRRETRDGTVVYILRTAPGTDQYLLPTREEAVGQALTFAERHGVQAWFDDGDRCVSLTNDRMAESAGVTRERPGRGAAARRPLTRSRGMYARAIDGRDVARPRSANTRLGAGARVGMAS